MRHLTTVVDTVRHEDAEIVGKTVDYGPYRTQPLAVQPVTTSVMLRSLDSSQVAYRRTRSDASSVGTHRLARGHFSDKVVATQASPSRGTCRRADFRVFFCDTYG